MLRSLRVPSRGYSRHFQFLKKFELPKAPEDQQNRIVVEVERRLSLLRETEAQVDANLQRAERLRQSILQGAFRCR